MSKPGSAQSQREFTLNRQKPADFAKLPADVQYLLDDKTEIGHTISEGLNVLYRVQPRHPIDYLAKWLLNHEATKLHKGTVHQDEQKAAEIVKKYDELAKEKQKEQDKRDAARMLHDKFENIFRDKIKNHEYHEELLNNELPSFIEKQQEIPAIYIGMLEHPSRAVGDEDDDEYAHLDKTATPLITYVGASGTQKFVIGRELPLVPESVTYAVFQPKEEEPPAEVAEGEEAPVNTKPNYLYIPDVTKEPRMVYFRIPRLGAYLACPLIYKSVLNEKSFDEGCAERLRVQEEIEKQKKDKEERDEQFQAKIQEAQAAGTETEEIEAEWKGFEWPVIEEKPFEYEERKFVLCVDTLGQDRELTEEERAYVSKLAQEFVQCWEESERRQLSRDIDTFLEAQKSVNKEEFIEATTKKLNEELAEKFQEEPEESELRQNARKAAIAAEYYRNRLAEEDVKKMIKGLASYRVIKYKPLIQSVLYFLGYKKGQINVPGTNLLDWKEVKKIISRDDFFTKLDEYEFKGPKEGYWERYALTDKLAPKFEKYNVEEIDQYNLGLGILYRYVKQVLDARLLDIQMRRTQKNDLRTKRDEVLKEVEAQKERHDNELAEVQAKAAEAEEAEEEFNKEEWEAKWLEANPPITVPEEVTDELDEDITPENVETA